MQPHLEAAPSRTIWNHTFTIPSDGCDPQHEARTPLVPLRLLPLPLPAAMGRPRTTPRRHVGPVRAAATPGANVARSSGRSGRAVQPGRQQPVPRPGVARPRRSSRSSGSARRRVPGRGDLECPPCRAVEMHDIRRAPDCGRSGPRPSPGSILSALSCRRDDLQERSVEVPRQVEHVQRRDQRGS